MVTTYPEQDEFCRLAKDYNIIPVAIDLPVDMETPVSIYYKLVGDDPGFILESAETSKSFGRYSFIGAEPFIKVVARSNHSEVTMEQETFQIDGVPLQAMENLLKRFSMPNLSTLPPFSGGAVGCFAYETVGTWERVRGMNISEDMILGEFIFCRVIIVMDHLTHSAKLMYLAHVKDEENAELEYEQALTQLGELINKLQRSVAMRPADSITSKADEPFVPGVDNSLLEDNFITMVGKAKEYIAAGDIFQVVLSQAFHRKLTKHEFALYRKLRQVNPSPYMFYINFGQRKLVGASPEMLVKLEGGNVFTCPIAGTRARGKNSQEDDILAAQLLADEKERAEHAMLVDLGRNDIGHISLPGTVKVCRMMQVEKFSHVMHMVSEVSGLLDPKFTTMNVLEACFPAGTVSGAPKVRAMEIINEIETPERGMYAGTVGYFDFRGNMDTCITIRTLVIDGDDVTIQTGAGIVADSVPEKEYQEILNKAKVLFQVVAEDTDHDFNY